MKYLTAAVVGFAFSLGGLTAHALDVVERGPMSSARVGGHDLSQRAIDLATSAGEHLQNLANAVAPEVAEEHQLAFEHDMMGLQDLDVHSFNMPEVRRILAINGRQAIERAMGAAALSPSAASAAAAILTMRNSPLDNIIGDELCVAGQKLKGTPLARNIVTSARQLAEALQREPRLLDDLPNEPVALGTPLQGRSPLELKAPLPWEARVLANRLYLLGIPPGGRIQRDLSSNNLPAEKITGLLRDIANTTMALKELASLFSTEAAQFDWRQLSLLRILDADRNNEHEEHKQAPEYLRLAVRASSAMFQSLNASQRNRVKNIIPVAFRVLLGGVEAVKIMAPVYQSFMATGFGLVASPMVILANQTFPGLSIVMGFLLTFSGFLSFAFLGVPTSILMYKRGMKKVLLPALAIMLLGLLVPMFAGLYGVVPLIVAGDLMKFWVLLGSIACVGAGGAMLQVIINPLTYSVSPTRDDFLRKVALGQAFQVIAVTMGFLLPQIAPALGKAFGLHLDWPILFPALTLIVFSTLLCSLYLLPADKGSGKAPSVLEHFSLLFKDPFVLRRVGSIFCYVGAEVCVITGVGLLLAKLFGITSLGVPWALFYLPFLVGRFASPVILKWVKPRLFLLVSMATSLAGLCIALLSGGMAGICFGVALTALGFSNVFPLIAGDTIAAMPRRANMLSALLVTAISGGAFIPMLMGKLAHLTSVHNGFYVPLAAALVFILAPLLDYWPVLRNYLRRQRRPAADSITIATEESQH